MYKIAETHRVNYTKQAKGVKSCADWHTKDFSFDFYKLN